MSPTPKRRWFRFTLRTLFVVVTVCACWLGWQIHIVHERADALQRLKVMGCEPLFRTNPRCWKCVLLGDVDVSGFEIPLSVLTKANAEIAKWFPESSLSDPSLYPGAE